MKPPGRRLPGRDAFNRYHARAPTPRHETGTAAYESQTGGVTLLVDTRSTPGWVHILGPATDEGRQQIASADVVRGDAHVHPDPDPSPRPSLVMGIDPARAPEAAVDSYIILPSGEVIQISYDHKGQVTTVDAVEERLPAAPVMEETDPAEVK
jgi:hypothetical protein